MFTHIDQNNLPTMVDVSQKLTTIRMAEAQTEVVLPPEILSYLQGEELILKKGPVFQTAIIAGTMATKRTHELIPFCHQIPIESAKFQITLKDLVVTITCQVKTSFKTGVEMEALHGAMTAALTVYDMCKAVSHNISIRETKLVSKTGGKKTVLNRPLYGLVLTGGKSSRMREPKALIPYRGKPHAKYIFDVLAKSCEKVFLSQKENQWKGTELDGLPALYDKEDGPVAAMLNAFESHPEANWMVVACDLVHFNEMTVQKLLAHSSDKSATCFKNREKGFPEPLCALYTPAAANIFRKAHESNITCPVKILKNADVSLLTQEEGINLTNVNTPEERLEVH
jgi:cyclic pyranopterin phosphate synthase